MNTNLFKKLFQNKTKVNNLTKKSFWTLLELPALEPLSILDGKFNKQKDGVDMCSPFGPTMANVYVILKNNECLIDYKPSSYWYYVDDKLYECLSLKY